MKFRKITALLLVLCMLLSLSISAFAAEADEHTIYDSAPDEETVVSNEAATSGTIQNSGIRWSLDEKGWLTISGSGEAPVFQSADDQPWAAVRDQITEVWFEDVETLSIPDLAYWFEGCVNLTTAELPLAPTIGRHAFYNCPKLSTLTMYYGETALESIGEDAFWRESDAGDTLYIGYIIGYPKSSVPFHSYDWIASNRSERYFYDLYGVYQNADAGSAATSGIKKAPGISVQSTGSIIGNCPSCGKYSFQGVYVEVAHSSRGHANYLSDNRNGNIQFFNLCPKLLGIFLDALCKEQSRINIVVTNGALAKLLNYVVSLSVAAEEAFSVGTLLILSKDDFTGADVHGAEDGVITDHSLFILHTNLAFRDNPCGQEVRGAPSSGWGFHPRSGMYLLNVYSIFKVREVFALTNQLGNFFRFVRSFFEIFQKIFFDHLSGIKKAPITSQRCNRGRNRKSPLIEISGLKSYEIIVCYRNLSAIAKFQTHFWRKLGVNWRKLWRKHRQF